MMTEQRLDAFFGNPIITLTPLWAPLLVFGVSLWLLRHQHIAVKVISPLLFAFAVFALYFDVLLRWILRDGLAPGIIVSHGQEAVDRFTKDIWSAPLLFGTIVFVGLLPCLISAFIGKRRRKRPHLQNKNNSVESH